MDYKSIVSDGNKYRKNYIDGIKDFIERKNKEGFLAREEFMPADKFAENLEEYRKLYHKMLGLDKLCYSKLPEPKMEFVGEDDDCKIYRVVVYVTPEIPLHGLLFKPHGVEKAPLIIAQHGGGGTPELCSDMNGKNNYNRMVRRLIEKGLYVFAPQLLLWNISDNLETAPKHNIPYSRRELDTQLKRFGISLTALEIKGIMNSITYLSTLDFIKADKIGMTGISYGGYFTLHTMAADTRIKTGYSNAVFNDRGRHPFPDWLYQNAANTFQDAEVAALCAPRKLYIAVGKEDLVFDYTTAILEAKRVNKYFEALGCPENYYFTAWDGEHTMSPTDEGYDFMLSAFE